MPWIFLPWHYLNLGERQGEGGVETDTNQTLWKQRDYTSPPRSLHPPTICNLPASAHSSCPSSAIHLLFVVCLPPRLKSLCVSSILSAGVRVCARMRVCMLSAL